MTRLALAAALLAALAAAAPTGAPAQTEATPPTGGGQPAPLDIQEQHPGGAIIQLSAIQVGRTETVITAQIINGADVGLNLTVSATGTYLLGAGGLRFFLSPPADNPNFTIEPQKQMEGDLVFLGGLPPTGSVKLVINDPSDGEAPEADVVINVPLPDEDFAHLDAKTN